jgi:hypothetical protein
MKWLAKAWDAAREGYFFVKPIRFVVAPLILLAWALISASEGQDAVRFLVEVDPRCAHYIRIAAFLLVVCAAALQVWYWSRQLLRVDDVSGAAARHEDAERRMPRILGASVFVIAVLALARAAYLGWSGHIDFTMEVIIGTCALLIVLLILFLSFCVQRRKWLDGREARKRVPSPKDFDTSTKWLLRGTAIVALLFVIWTALWPLATGSLLQSPALLMLSADLWAGLGSWLAYWFDLYKVPLASTFLVAAIVFSCFNDNHAVRTLTPPDGGSVAARKPLDVNFNAWYGNLEKNYGNEATHPIFIVATEGGGIRAAYWTASVLTAIQDQAPQFADHLFAISGVSGGSVGSMVFTALVADHARGPVIPECKSDAGSDRSYRRAAQEMLSYDALAPTLASMLHADFVQRFLPIGFIPDRAKALETGWEEGWRTHIGDDYFGKGMLRMYNEAGGKLPSLFLNGTSVEAGNRLIGSNCDLHDGQIPDAVDLFGELGQDVRLSTAAHNSARFTYVSPAGTIHQNGGKVREHVVDGGYFENSGAQTAADIIARLDQIRVNRPYTLNLILIKFQEIDTTLPCAIKPAKPVAPESFMNEVMSPLRALLATRDARGTLAYEEARRIPQVTKYEFILTQEKRGIILPLGWLLAGRTRNAIDLQIGPIASDQVPCAIKPTVDLNDARLWTIAKLLNPPLTNTQPHPDATQNEAAASEKEAKQ